MLPSKTHCMLVCFLSFLTKDTLKMYVSNYPVVSRMDIRNPYYFSILLLI